MRPKIAHTLVNIKKLVCTYPLFLVSATVLMLAVQALIENTLDDSFTLIKIAYTAALGISVFFGIALLGQRIGKRWLWNCLGLVLLMCFYLFVLPEEKKLITEKYIFILVPAYILSHLFVSIAPFLKDKQEENRFWQYNKTLFVNFFLTIVFTGVLCGGVQLALLAVNHLFGLSWEYEIYLRVFFALLIFGSAVIFGMFHVEGLKKMEESRPYPVVIAFFTQFILIPLLLIYAGILYIYGIKILLTWDLPRGWVSYLILTYGMLGILALLLVHPLLGGSSKAWVGWFKKLFYYSLLPLLALLFVAIGTRISEYGFTEARYFVLLLALWLTFVTCYFILSAKPSIRTIPYSLWTAGLCALILPYINALDLSVRSQKKAFMQLLVKENLLKEGKINTQQAVSRPTVNALQSKYVYLYYRNKHEFVWELIEANSLEDIQKSAWNFRTLFPQIIADSTDYSYTNFYLDSKSKLQEISNYTHLIQMEVQNELKFKIGADSLFIRQKMYGNEPQFSLSVNGSSKDLVPFIDSLVHPYLQGQTDAIVEDLSFVVEHEGYQCKVTFNQISVEIPKGEPRYYLSQMTFLFRSN